MKGTQGAARGSGKVLTPRSGARGKRRAEAPAADSARGKFLAEGAENADGLPLGWGRCSVGQIFRSFSGGTPNRGTSAYWKGKIPWLSSGDIKSARIGSASESITKAGLENSSAKLCRQGSVLVVVRSGILKHTLPVALLEHAAAINQDIKCFDSGNDALNEWFALALRSAERELLSQNREGTTVQSVKYETLKDFELPVPPLREQRRIAAKLKALLGHVDACRKRLERVPTLLKRFRQAVLAAACSGRLTADWRQENDPPESAPGLLARLFKDRERKALAQDRKRRAVPASVEADELAALPELWQWATLDQVVEEGRPIIYGIIKPGPHDPKGVPYVRVFEMKDGKVSPLSELKRASPERAAKFTRATLKAGDLLISKDGTIGRVAIVPPELEGGNITQHLVRATVHPFLDREFIAHAIRAQHSQNWLVGEKKGVALQGVNVEDFRRLPLPIPPLAEQHEIVRRVERLFALADAIEARYTKARAQVEALTPTLLAKAFRGELVPQDPNDEPASVLLERLTRCERGQ